MSTSKRLSNVYKTSPEIPFNNKSKIIIMSDCHRGDGRFGDNFSKNKIIFAAALNHYYNENYTYFELGDGDELWENKYLGPIIKNHTDIFNLMAKFYNEGRFHMIYGNRDLIKREKFIQENVLREYYDERTKKYVSLFPHIDIREGLILKNSDTSDTIFLVHGHQGDFINDEAWKISRLLVRYVWRPLELIGIHNPTSAATNDRKKRTVENKIIDWTIKNQQMLIAGHVHKTMFPQVNEHLYFNDGCCTHERHITGIEIVDGFISLVKWSVKTRDDKTLYVEKDVMEGPTKLKDYFDSKYTLKTNKKD